jgi:hAT family C-terminal dimerisation region
LILNPSFRTRYIETNWPKTWAKIVLVKVKKLWEKYREEVAPLPTFSYGNPARELPELDAFDRIALSLCSVNRPASGDEYEDYNLQESYDPGKKGALAWWYQDTQRQRWPRLSLMAIDILSIPPMSDEPERVFSGARRTVSWDRGAIEPETIEMRECLKHWKRSGILNTFFEDS